MKLTKQQIESLSSVITKRINNAIKEHNDTISSQNNFMKWLEKNHKYKNMLDELKRALDIVRKEEAFKNCLDYYIDNTSLGDDDIMDTLRCVFESTLDFKESVSEEDVYNDIVIKTIESTSLEQVELYVYQKYTNAI